MDLEELKNKYKKLNYVEVKKELDSKLFDISNLSSEVKTLSVLTDSPHPLKTLSIEYCVLYDVAKEKGFKKSELGEYAKKYLDHLNKLFKNIQ